MVDKKNSNNVLQRARLRQGFTQRRLAELVGVEEQTVRRWEHGLRAVRPEFIVRLSELLDASPEDLGLLPPVVSENDVVDDVRSSAVVVNDAYVLSERDENRHRMLQRIWSRWIVGLLDQIESSPLIPLRLHMESNTVSSPWRDGIINEPVLSSSRFLSPDTSILEVYDMVGGELLILGEPGGGKTTLLLVLLRDLLMRSQDDARSPMPVVFNLSFWAEKQLPFEAWIVDELVIHYQIPVGLAQQWVVEDKIFPLLDGLDEVDASVRDACVMAVNHYRQGHGLLPLVVCCRMLDYKMLQEKLVLGGACVLEPLTAVQIDEYLILKNLSAMQLLLQRDPLLFEMASTPLMLNILTLIYDGSDHKEMQALQSSEDLRRYIFERYVARVLLRRGGKKTRYTQEQTKYYLGWLARQMQSHHQTEFYIERMQPDWLPDERTKRTYRNISVILIYGYANFVSNALFGLLRGGKKQYGDGLGEGILGWFGAGHGNKVLGWMSLGLGGGVNAGGTIGLIYGVMSILIGILITKSVRGILPHSSQGVGAQPTAWMYITEGLRQGVRNGVKIALIIALFACVLFGTLGGVIIGKSGIIIGIQYGISIGLISGLLVGLITGVTASFPSLPFKKLQRSTRVIDTCIVAICAGGGFALANSFFVGWAQGLAYGAVISLLGALFFSADERIGSQLIQGLGEEIHPIEFVHWSWKNVRQSVADDGRQALLIAVSIMVAVAIIVTVTSGWFHGLTYGLRYGLIFGLIVGITVGVARFFVGILNHGWTGLMLDEHQFDRVGEGILRSLRNSLFAALIFGPLGGLASGLVVGISFGLIGQLSGWLILAMGFTFALGLVFMVTFWNTYGGAACVGYVLLRLSLWRFRSIPWNYVRFLDYAVDHVLLRKIGGGYIFVHSLLLEYFAGLEEKEINAEKSKTSPQ